MKLNIETLIADFRQYLIANAQDVDSKDIENISGASIFTYSDYFEDFVEEKFEINMEEASFNIEDLFEMDMEEGQFVMPDDDETKVSEDELMLTILNALLADEEFVKNLDETNDGKLDSDEIKKFLTYSNEQDDDADKLTFADMAFGAIDVQKRDYKPSDIDLNTKNEIKETQSISSSSGGGGGSYSGSYGSSGSSSVKTKEVEKNPYSGQSVETLEAKEKEEQAAYDTSKEEYLSACNGTHAQLQESEKAVDDAQKTFTDSVKEQNETLGKQLDDILTKSRDLGQEQLAVSEELSITEQEITVQTQIETDSNARITSLQSLKSNLQGSLSSLGSDEVDARASVNAQISQVEAQITAEEQKRDEATKAKEELNAKKTELEASLQTLDQSLIDLQTQLSEISEEINKILEDPAIASLYEAFTQAQAQHETKREELASISQKNMTTAQTNLQNIREELAVAHTREDKKDFSNNAIGVGITEYAAQFEGYKESDGSADIFMKPHGLTSDTPWCAGFVEYILKNSGDYESIPQWYKDVENKLYCPTIYRDAKKANAVVEEQDTQAGDLIIYLREGTASHIGIIESIEQNSNGEWVVTTIEGNSGNAVTKHELVYKDRNDLKFLKVT